MTEQRNYEEEARKQGWKPEEEWEGDPPQSGFKSAEQFVKDGEEIPGILKSRIERLESRIEQLTDSNRQLNEFSKRSLEKEKKEKQNVIKELEEIRKKAIDEGDGAAFTDADNRINELRQDDGPKEQDLDPAAQDWLQHNPWYQTNDKLAAFADGIAERLIRQGFTGQAYWSELTKQTQEAFPNEFENPNRRKPNSVEGDAKPSSKDSNAKTFDNLPPDAKAQYQIFKRDIPGFTKEQYVEQYDWDEE